VWEATVVPALADCGIRYVTVDDYHFLASGKSADELDGYFTTEEDGRRLDLFPISEALRYRIPFALAADTVSHIESLAREPRSAAAIYFDDIEKFGIWPETYEWVYEKGWLREFIERVLASEKNPHPDVRRIPRARAHARRRLSADHVLYRNERVDAAGARGACLCRSGGTREARRQL